MSPSDASQEPFTDPQPERPHAAGPEAAPEVASSSEAAVAGAQPRRTMTSAALHAGGMLAVAAVASAVRLAPWRWVFGEVEPRVVGDGDVIYHLVQAGRLVEQGLQAVWTDPLLNYPLGAQVPWPPLFDALLAGAGWLAAGGVAPGAGEILLGALWVPVGLGVATALLLAWLGRALLGGRLWLDAALVLALLPAHARMTVLGRADQHALEPLLLCLLLLGAARLAGAVGPSRAAGQPNPAGPAGQPGPAGAAAGRGAAALVAVAAAAAFWNWNGSALYLALVAGFAATLHAAAAPMDPAPGRTAAGLCAGLLGGALLLAGSVALLAPDGALRVAGLSGLTGLQPTLVAGAALTCGAIAGARRLRPAAGLGERVATAAAALLLPPVLMLAMPWSREAIDRGLAMLQADGWYRYIQEFRPPIPSGAAPLATDLARTVAVHGLTFLAVPPALALAWRRWRRAPPGAREPALLFGVVALGALLLGVARSRFGHYLALVEALSTALVARELAAWVASRRPGPAEHSAQTGASSPSERDGAGGPIGLQRPPGLAGPAAGLALGILLVAPVLPDLPGGAFAPLSPERYDDWWPLGRLAASVTPAPGREAIQAPWNMGHDLRASSGRPVISSPFGVEGGPGALEADAAFHRALDQESAEALLAARRVAFVVVLQPLAVVASLEAYAPPGAPPVIVHGVAPGRLDDLQDLPALLHLVATRLWLWDGQFGEASGRLLERGLRPLDAFRLLGEGAATTPWRAVEVPATKLFQHVPGARVVVRGARPGARVEARVTLVTDRGREVAWGTYALADAAGVARLRLPYATGQNGAVLATPWRLQEGEATAVLAVPERAVLLGASVEAALQR